MSGIRAARYADACHRAKIQGSIAAAQKLGFHRKSSNKNYITR